MPRLTPEQRDELQRMWREGLPMKVIADAMGMSIKRLDGIVRRDRVRFPYRKPRRGKV